jgi:phosphate transport system substrate-binding protein
MLTHAHQNASKRCQPAAAPNPFWEPEYAYTYGPPPPNSLTSKFLDFLAGDTGRNLIERHGHLPCSAPEIQQACQRAHRA